MTSARGPAPLRELLEAVPEGTLCYLTARAALASLDAIEAALGKSVCHPDDPAYLCACIEAALALILGDTNG